MSSIIKYGTFQSSDQFEAWQKGNVNVQVLQVQPIIQGFSFGEDEAEIKGYVNPDVSVFVTYVEKPDIPVVL